MSGKLIDISCAHGHSDTIVSSAEHLGATVLSNVTSGGELARANIRVFVLDSGAQELLDRLQSLLPAESKSLILIQTIDTTLPADPESDEDSDHAAGSTSTREELFQEVREGAKIDLNFIILAVLATVVAAIGLAEDNVAAVIAAMVIAPLLGPNLGLSLGAALGDKDLIKTALATNFVGVTITIALSAAFALIWSPNLDSAELVSRTTVRPSSIALALASGIAAVLSMTAWLPSLLVGVMVAVALVPPASVFGMMLGAGQWTLAAGAATLLAVNVVALNLSAQLVFLLRGVRPRSWLERRAAAQSTWVNLTVWGSLLALIAILISIIGA